MGRSPALALISLVVLGCGSVGPTSNPSPAATDPGPSTSASSSSAASPSAVVVPSPSADGLALESVAVVVTDDLRVRSAPGVGEQSVTYEPLLQRGSMLYVIDGPVGDSGYAWYEVLTFDVSLTQPGDDVDGAVVEDGWVAVADKDGEVWVQAADVDCPPEPSDVREIVALDGVTAIACFGGEPLTISGRILDCRSSPELRTEDWCGADTGGSAFEPSWFDRSFKFVVPDAGTFDHDSMMELRADPLGTYPDPLPLGTPVSLTGQFDHPAASACRQFHFFINDAPTVYCRTIFAVTTVTSP